MGGSTAAMATGCGTGTPARAASSWPSPSFGRGRIFRSGCWERRRRAEQALISVVATSYLLGSRRGGWKTRRPARHRAAVEEPVQRDGQDLDARSLPDPAPFRTRSLDAGPYTFAWLDALTQKLREGGRTVIVHALIAVRIQRRGPARSPRPGRGPRRGRRGLAGLPAHSGSPRAVRCGVGHLRQPPGPCRGGGGHPASVREGPHALAASCSRCAVKNRASWSGSVLAGSFHRPMAGTLLCARTGNRCQPPTAALCPTCHRPFGVWRPITPARRDPGQTVLWPPRWGQGSGQRSST